MKELVITNDNIKTILNKLKVDKSPGPDELHPKFIKELSEELNVPLQILFTNSYKHHTLPDKWKQGNITALFKKGKKNMVQNYRPVSLTSIIGKCMEKIIREHITQHMTANNLFSNKQYGFISGRSTTIQLLKVLDEWTTAIDQGHNIDCIYMDFQKAFDKVPHKRLILKLKYYKLHQTIINWIEDFLKNRKQKVVVQGQNSIWSPVTSGIPQGSILGPLLFVIYINDLPDITQSSTYLFADDTKIFRQITCEQDKNTLQNDLYKLQEWTDTWLLKFHPDKCKSITLGKTNNQNTYNLKIDGKLQNLEQVTQEKDIGVITDSKLTFEQHITEKINKSNSMFSIIRRSFDYLNETNFKQLYKSMVRSHLDYASSVWHPYKMSQIDKIEKVQRRATKQIPSLKDLTYEERLKKLRLPTLTYRRIRGDMIETYKILNNIYDKNICNFLKTKNLSNNRISPRGNNLQLIHQQVNTGIKQNQFSIRIINTWNSLPDEIVNAPTINSFKNRLDKYWKHQDVLYNYRAVLNLGAVPNRNQQTTEPDIVATTVASVRR